MTSLEALDSQVKAVISKNKLSSSAVDSIVKLALDNVASDTSLITILYRQHKKASSTHKLTSLYLIDAIARGARSKHKKQGKSKEPEEGSTTPKDGTVGEVGTYGSFLKKLEGILSKIVLDVWENGPAEHREKVRKVLDIWTKAGTFSSSALARLGNKLLAATSSATSASNDKSKSASSATAGLSPVAPAMSPEGPSASPGLGPAPPASTTLFDSTGSGTTIPANVLALLQATAQPEPSQAAIEQKKREEEEETIRRVLAEAQGGVSAFQPPQPSVSSYSQPNPSSSSAPSYPFPYDSNQSNSNNSTQSHPHAAGKIDPSRLALLQGNAPDQNRPPPHFNRQRSPPRNDSFAGYPPRRDENSRRDGGRGRFEDGPNRGGFEHRGGFDEKRGFDQRDQREQRGQRGDYNGGNRDQNRGERFDRGRNDGFRGGNREGDFERRNGGRDQGRRDGGFEPRGNDDSRYGNNRGGDRGGFRENGEGNRFGNGQKRRFEDDNQGYGGQGQRDGNDRRQHGSMGDRRHSGGRQGGNSWGAEESYGEDADHGIAGHEDDLYATEGGQFDNSFVVQQSYPSAQPATSMPPVSRPPLPDARPPLPQGRHPFPERSASPSLVNLAVTSSAQPTFVEPQQTPSTRPLENPSSSSEPPFKRPFVPSVPPPSHIPAPVSAPTEPVAPFNPSTFSASNPLSWSSFVAALREGHPYFVGQKMRGEWPQMSDVATMCVPSAVAMFGWANANGGVSGGGEGQMQGMQGMMMMNAINGMGGMGGMNGMGGMGGNGDSTGAMVGNSSLHGIATGQIPTEAPEQRPEDELYFPDGEDYGGAYMTAPEGYYEE